jgi:cytochrome c553
MNIPSSRFVAVLALTATGALLIPMLATAASAVAPGQAATQAPITLTSPVTGNATNGKQLYYDHACYSCHGYNGETGARAFVPNWPGVLTTEASFLAFLRLRADVAPEQPSTNMPNYPAASLSDTQARDIYAYIRSFKSDPPLLEKIPTMTRILERAQRSYKP